MSEPVYRCVDCDREWPQSEGGGRALAEAINHPCDASTDPEIVYDDGLDWDGIAAGRGSV